MSWDRTLQVIPGLQASCSQEWLLQMIPGFHFGVSFIAAPVKENEWFPKREQQQIFFLYTHYENRHTHILLKITTPKIPKFACFCCLIWCWPGFTSNGRLLKIEASQRKQTKYRHMRRVWNRFEATYSTTTPQHSRSIPPGFFVVVVFWFETLPAYGVLEGSLQDSLQLATSTWKARFDRHCGYKMVLIFPYTSKHLLRFGIWTSKNIP